MMTEELTPREVFRFFEEICRIPHGSGDTKRISDHCVRFAEERGLSYIRDAADNIIIRKPGTEGYEESEPVILQGHLDMVCEKRPGSAHDFSRDGLSLFTEDGYLKARDTTLGGDDGIAVAMALAVLDSKDIPHPPIEAVFTTDEETGMDGAWALDMSVLKGKKLINIDSEEEGILTVGCAGGFHYETVIPVTREERTGAAAEIRIHGLLGGHSGAEIHRQRGNAHKLMGRLLNVLLTDEEIGEISLISLSGGSKDNVIAMESSARILAAESDMERIEKKAAEMQAVWRHEFMGEEPGLAVSVVPEGVSQYRVCDRESTGRVVTYLVICPNGVQGMSRGIEGLVETSLNMGIVDTREDAVTVTSLVRSSVESKKQELKEILALCAAAAGGSGKASNEYPAWQLNPDSELRRTMAEVYEEMFGKPPVVSAIHAGLECGLFMGKRADLDCVSFGPDIPDVHSFKERLDIASTGRMWEYLKAVLAALK